MQCVKCGADLPPGADVCPECGEGVYRGPGASAAGVASPAPRRSSAAPKRRRTLLLLLAAVVIVAVVGVGGYLALSRGTALTGPDGAAVRMMTAFAQYDAQGILDNATHESLTTTDQASFSKQIADEKVKDGSLAAVKDIKVVRVTIASPTATTATVQLSASWLTDPSKGTYTPRTETLTVIKQGGKWLVRLFQ